MIIKGSRILITGGSSGIGKAAAKLFTENGASVGITGRDKDKLEQVANEISAFAIHADAGKESDIDIIVEFLPNTENLSDMKASLKEAIKNAFDRDVDICREKYLKPYYRNQILKSAIYV